MSPDRPDELINQPQPGSYNNNERPEKYEWPQGLSMGDLEPRQCDPREQKCSCKNERQGSAHLPYQSAAIRLHSCRFGWNYLLEEFWFHRDFARKGRVISSEQHR